MIRSLCLPTLLLAALAMPAAAQSCSQFSVSGTGHRGTMMMFHLSGGHPHGLAFMALSMNEGHAYFNYGPMGMLHLGLANPILMLPMGQANALGEFHMQAQVPHHLMHRAQVYAQCFTAMVHAPQTCHGPMQLSFCPSNVVGMGIGGSHGH